jgi:hypothetical protein
MATITAVKGFIVQDPLRRKNAEKIGRTLRKHK